MRLVITALLILSAAPACADFVHTNPEDARVNCARLGRIVVEMSPEPSISVAYTEGYCPDAATFRPLGSNHIVLRDIPAQPATGHPEYPDFTQAIADVQGMLGPGFTSAAELWLQAKIAEIRERESNK